MYKSLWFKLHWAAGVFLGLFLIIVGFSGAVLSYQKEIMRAINPSSYTVVVGEQMMSLSEILDSFAAKNSDAKINSITISSDRTSSAVVNIAHEGQKRGKDIYINPYSGETLPDVAGSEFFMFFFKLHRWLAFDGAIVWVGKQIIAIATLTIIFLMVSGVVINWSRIKRGFISSLLFSFKSKNRHFLSTMHSALGMWAVPVVLVISLSGLYWSYDWYRDGLYAIMGVEKPQRFNKSVQKPKDGVRGDRGEALIDKASVDYKIADRAYEAFRADVADEFKEATISLKPHDGHYDVRYLELDAPHFRATSVMEIDAFSFEILSHNKYSQKALNERIMSSMLPIHSGEYWGWIGQFIFFVSSLLVVLFTITGYMLYFDRKRKKLKSKS